MNNKYDDLQFVSFDTVTVNNWDVKISHYSDQILTCLQHRDTGRTIVRFFTDQYQAYYWIDWVVGQE